MRIKPECRVCGAQVEYMGDYCPDCEEYELDAYDDSLEFPSSFQAIANADIKALQDKQSADDY